jgi:hypothetical protein
MTDEGRRQRLEQIQASIESLEQKIVMIDQQLAVLYDERRTLRKWVQDR